MKRKRNTNQTTSYSHVEQYRGHELETPCTVVYDVEPGEKAVRCGDNACPGADPDCEIFSVTIDATGEDITDEADLDAIKDSILEDYAASEAGDDDDRAYDEMKDRLACGED
jgi:hypothetical protein